LGLRTSPKFVKQFSFPVLAMQPQPIPIWISEGGLILKVMLLSGIIALGIKLLGPQLRVPETTTVALMVVLLPAVIIGLILGILAVFDFKTVDRP
jgi:hypothetical protein